MLSTKPSSFAQSPETLLSTCASALDAAETYLGEARRAVSELVAQGGRQGVTAIEAHQHETHGFAWLATYVESLRQMLGWAQRLSDRCEFGELEQLMLGAAYGEYLRQMASGIAMSQVEVARPSDLGLEEAAARLASHPAAAELQRSGNTAARRQRIAALISQFDFGNISFGDETLDMIREQFRRFADERIAPQAHDWHLKNQFIPLEIIDEMAALGVFGLTAPEEYEGSGLGKLAMVIVSEELSRGYIGVGSLSTRCEIAVELIHLNGTAAQKEKYLKKLATGKLLPAAVFTEPNTGSDLASLKTRAALVEKPDGKKVWKVTGAKTWITHAARADVMTLLVRTDPGAGGYRGLSMLLAEKPRGSDDNPFPAQGMTGGEIEVLGYRGMKEYEIGFDGFEVPEENLLGGVPGEGFKQLMQTFESARIQTAARATGVAQNALEIGLRYALDRVQFGRPLVAFPRVAGKLAWMAVETMILRQLTYFAAREKDRAMRCDIEAGMAKLLGARVAWANADNALQIHGGNGFALEYQISRVLCDARILNIFEGAAEIQAQVIARGLLESGRN